MVHHQVTDSFPKYYGDKASESNSQVLPLGCPEKGSQKTTHVVGYNAICICQSQNRAPNSSQLFFFFSNAYCHWTRRRKNVGKLINIRPSAAQGTQPPSAEGSNSGESEMYSKDQAFEPNLQRDFGYLGYEVKSTVGNHYHCLYASLDDNDVQEGWQRWLVHRLGSAFHR